MGLKAQTPDLLADAHSRNRKGQPQVCPIVSGLCHWSIHSAHSLEYLVCARPSPGRTVTIRPALVFGWLTAGTGGRYLSGESGTEGPGSKGGSDWPHPGRGFLRGSRGGIAFELATEDEQDGDLWEPSREGGVKAESRTAVLPSHLESAGIPRVWHIRWDQGKDAEVGNSLSRFP